jgi:hypothetical protein
VSLQRLQEAYPELTSQRNFESLQVDLSGTENRIGRARERYNAAVQEYNTTIRTFPGRDRRARHLRLQADGAVRGDTRIAAGA